MRSIRVLCVPLAMFGAILLSVSPPAAAQTEFENTLKQFSGDAVKGYVQPVADLYGANMMAGQFRSAAIPIAGLSISLDFVGMAALVTDDQKKYTAKTPEGFDPATFETATVFGDKGATVTHRTLSGLSYRGKDGIFTSSYVPLAVPQLRVGAVAGTEAMIRGVGFPKSGDGDVPAITFFGIGVRHSVSQYLPMVPLDIAAAGFYTSFKMGDMIKAKGFSFGVHASKEFSLLTVYGGLAYEKTTMDLSYTSTDPGFSGQSVDVSLDGANTFRATAGLGLGLGVFNLFADVNVGSVTHFSGGFGFSF